MKKIDEKEKEILKECIENIEQLGADARYENNYENYNKLQLKLESIMFWSEKAKKIIEKKQK